MVRDSPLGAIPSLQRLAPCAAVLEGNSQGRIIETVSQKTRLSLNGGWYVGRYPVFPQLVAETINLFAKPLKL